MKKIFLLLLFLNACFYPINPSERNPHVRVLKNNTIIKVPLEKYVAHVLAGEVAFNWPKEALKAQAVAIRTYALKKMQENKHKKFDVQATVMDQVFKDSTHKNFIEAALATKGLVMKYNHELVEASFHSTCGGHTASAQSVFGREYSYLQARKCNYCQKSPSFSWKTSIALSNINKTFNTDAKAVEITQKQGVRAKSLAFIGRKNLTVKAHDFRMKISAMKVKSTYITGIKINGSNLDIHGQGFGHGVGMCQYGAKEMAAQGNNFKNILSYYYQNISLQKIY